MGFSDYYAVACKVKALYGYRLTQEEFNRLASMKSIADIASYLRNCQGWKAAMDSLTETDVHRGELEAALNTQLQDEYSRIFKFMTMKAKEFLLIFVYREDMNHVLLALRRIQTGGSPVQDVIVPEFYRTHGSVDYEALGRCEDYLGLLSAISGSIFYEPLRAIMAVEGSTSPDYTAASLAVQSVYYIAMDKFVQEKVKDSEKDIILKQLSGTVDLINVSHVMRVKKYFPGSLKDVREVLIPKFFKLRPAFFKALYEAPGIDGAYNMLKDSFYGELFNKHNFEYIEQYQMYWKYAFDKKQLLWGAPSVYTPMAYISLKEHEMHRLINIIECVRYGLPANSAETLAVY